MKRVAWFAIAVFFTLTLVALLWRFHVQAGLLIFAVLIAAAVRPAATYLTARGVPYVASLLIIYLAGIVLVATMFSLLSVAFVREMQLGTNSLIAGLWRADPALAGAGRAAAGNRRTATGGRPIAGRRSGRRKCGGHGAGRDRIVLRYGGQSGDRHSRQHLLGRRLRVAGTHVAVAATGRERVRARLIWDDIETQVGAYIRSESVQVFLAILLLEIGFTLLHMPFKTALSVLGGVLWLIPLAGGPLALIPVILLGLSQGVVYALVATLYTTAVFCLLEFVVQPRMVRLPRASSVLIVIFLLALSDLLGVVGLLIAPALAVATQIILQGLFPAAPVARTEPQVTSEELGNKIRTERARIDSIDGRGSPELASMLQRVDCLIEDVENVKPLAGQQPAPARGKRRKAS